MLKNKLFPHLRYWTSVTVVGVVLGLAIQFVSAWTEPTSTPPNGNIGAPINTSDTWQIKDGMLIINNLAHYTIGLFVNGKIKITDGFQGAGKVLTSDDTGLASWQAPSGGSLPVGSVFLAVVSTNPNSLLGYGTWVQIAKGRALVGQDPADADWDVAEETRGEKAHTLTQAEMPSHYHTVDPPYANTGGFSNDHSHYVSGYTGGITANHTHAATTWFWVNASGGSAQKQLASTATNAALGNPSTGTVSSDHSHWWGAQTGGVNANHYHGVDIGQFNSGNAGSGAAFNNIQPSFVIFVWKRTS